MKIGRFVYFAKVIEMESPIKIGCTSNPDMRLQRLMAWVPFQMEIMAFAPGGYVEESRVHRRFASSRLHGEWFSIDPALTAFISAIKASGVLPFDVAKVKRAPMGGLAAMLKKNSITLDGFAELAGVMPVVVYAWMHDTAGLSSVGRALGAFDTLGIPCQAEELFRLLGDVPE